MRVCLLMFVIAISWRFDSRLSLFSEMLEQTLLCLKYFQSKSVMIADKHRGK